jgi:hypothetical protein
MGAGGQDHGHGIAVDGSGNIYTTGIITDTADFDPTAGTYNLTSRGSWDVFVSMLTQGSPLLAAGGPAAGHKSALLSDADLQPILAAAIDRWAAAGLDAERLRLLRGATVSIEDLDGAYLGLAYSDSRTIRLDDDAASHGWFVDPTPHDDSEFTTPGDQGEAGRMDLLSVVAHELGHLLGLDDLPGDEHAGDLMGATLTTGTRRTSAVADAPERGPTPRQRAEASFAWLWTPSPRRQKAALFAEWLATTDGAES